jgi:hypothetical protein
MVLSQKRIAPDHPWDGFFLPTEVKAGLALTLATDSGYDPLKTAF